MLAYAHCTLILQAWINCMDVCNSPILRLILNIVEDAGWAMKKHVALPCRYPKKVHDSFVPMTTEYYPRSLFPASCVWFLIFLSFPFLFFLLAMHISEYLVLTRRFLSPLLFLIFMCYFHPGTSPLGPFS